MTKKEIKRLIQGSNEELLSWLECLKAIPDCLWESALLTCRDCKYAKVQAYDGCDELGCFISRYEKALDELREELTMAYNEGYYNNGQLNWLLDGPALIAGMFA